MRKTPKEEKGKASHTKIAKEEIEMEKLTITRRDFLKASAVTGAAAALYSPDMAALKGLVEAKEPIVEGQVEKIRDACRACGKMECGLWVTKRDGRVIRIEGDETCFTSEGHCCTKSMASIQALYHPDRLLYPMKRTRPKGEDPGWVRISWEEALDTAAKKFQELKEKYGGESLFGIHGTSRITSYAGFSCLQGLGSPNTVHPGQVCKAPRASINTLTTAPNFHWMALVDGVKVFTQWGSATEISNYDDSCRVTVDRRFKADKHIVVGPRLQNLGKEADIWLPLRPGTDTAMALSWMDVIIKEGLYDREFVEKWTNGPFLYCSEIEPTGWTWDYDYYPLEIRTRLLKESDLVEGGSVKKFLVWDEISGELRYFDADSGEWEVEPPQIKPALLGTYTVTLKDGREVEAKPVFQLLADRAAEYTPEKAEEITWVPAEKIREAARVYASQPGNGGIHYMLGVEQSANCSQNIRSLCILVGITGNVDTPGGHRGSGDDMYSLAPRIPYMAVIQAPPLPLEQMDKELGADKYKLLPWWSTSGATPNFPADATSVTEAIHTGVPYPVKGCMSMTGNCLNQANATRSWEAFKKLDFYFCSELWLAPMAELADIVVPCTHWLQTPVIRCSQGSHHGMGAQTGSVPPLGEERQDYMIAIQLAEKLGIPVIARTLEEVMNLQVMPLGITWKEFLEKFQKEGWMDIKPPYRRYELGMLRKDEKPGFPLPTMKLEILSTIIESYHPGQELPVHQEPPESPIARPDLVEEYPIILITGRKIPVYFHSEHRQLPWCREIWPEPRVEINPETAAELGIEDGDWVWIESPRGRVRQKADLFAGIHPKVANAEHAWWHPELPAPEHGWHYTQINALVDQFSQDPLSGATCLRGYPVKIYKAEEGPPPGIITSPVARMYEAKAEPEDLEQWLPKPPGGA